MSDREYDPLLDSYESWRAFIEILRQRWLAGETIEGPWAKRLATYQPLGSVARGPAGLALGDDGTEHDGKAPG